MRAAPALQVSVDGRAASRWLVVALAALSAAAVVWWLGSRLDSPVGSTTIALCVAAAFAAGLAWRVAGQPAQTLRFDGQGWQLSSPAARGMQGPSGDLAVVIDLGTWMLLRFDAPARDGHGSRRRWLPVGRRGLEAQWHALRCAVYSPRPGAPPGARDAPDPFSRE